MRVKKSGEKGQIPEYIGNESCVAYDVKPTVFFPLNSLKDIEKRMSSTYTYRSQVLNLLQELCATQHPVHVLKQNSLGTHTKTYITEWTNKKPPIFMNAVAAKFVWYPFNIHAKWISISDLVHSYHLAEKDISQISICLLNLVCAAMTFGLCCCDRFHECDLETHYR